MSMAEDGFNLAVALSHTDRDPETITSALRLEPDFAWAKGMSLESGTLESTRWRGRLASGAGEEEYAVALQSVCSFLSANAQFFHTFQEEEGVAELVMNYGIGLDEGKVLEISYSPALLRQLVDLGIWLRVEAWAGRTE